MQTMTDDRMRITEFLRLEGASRDRLVPPTAHSRHSYSGLFRDAATWVLNISKGGDSTTSLGNRFCCLTTLTITKKLFLMYKWNFPYFIPVASCPLSVQTRGNHPIRCSYTWIDRAGSAPVCPCLSCTGSPEMGTALQM